MHRPARARRAAPRRPGFIVFMVRVSLLKEQRFVENRPQVRGRAGRPEAGGGARAAVMERSFVFRRRPTVRPTRWKMVQVLVLLQPL